MKCLHDSKYSRDLREVNRHASVQSNHYACGFRDRRPAAFAQDEKPDPCANQPPEQDCDATPPPPPCIPIERWIQFNLVYRDRPYSGTRVSTCEKRLEDGTVFKATRTSWEWRDAQGRMRVEHKDVFPGLSKRRNVTVYDPVAHLSWDWNEGENAGTTATLVRHKATEDFIEPDINRHVLPDGSLDPPLMAHFVEPETSGHKQIFLAPTHINGVWAEGQRLIIRILPGTGNNHTKQTQITTNEFWVSTELQVEVRHLADDPGQDKTTDNLVDIDLREPDPALFRPPTNYEVLDATPKMPIPAQKPLTVIPVPKDERGTSPN